MCMTVRSRHWGCRWLVSLDKLTLRQGLAVSERFVTAEEHEAHDGARQDVEEGVGRHLRDTTHCRIRSSSSSFWCQF